MMKLNRQIKTTALLVFVSLSSSQAAERDFQIDTFYKALIQEKVEWEYIISSNLPRFDAAKVFQRKDKADLSGSHDTAREIFPITPPYLFLKKREEKWFYSKEPFFKLVNNVDISNGININFPIETDFSIGVDFLQRKDRADPPYPKNIERVSDFHLRDYL